ncbi:MAG: RNA polymerase sigma factor [Candidatus Hydrogenedentes bacterium]|nr:RNA polymerase sigma factor [Candidatus Hydrogenedentota bacterium]
MRVKRENILPFEDSKENFSKSYVLREKSRELPLSEWTDEDLMLAFGDGNEEAFVEIVSRYEKQIFNYMYRMVHNWHIAEDLTQEVFMALVNNATRYHPSAKFSTYIYTIASNIISKEWNKQNRRPKFFSLSQWLSGEKNNEDIEKGNPIEHLADSNFDILKQTACKEISEAVNEALKKIPPHQREAFVLRRFLELSYEEIADILDIPVGTVKTRVLRAERALRPFLSQFRDHLK